MRRRATKVLAAGLVSVFWITSSARAAEPVSVTTRVEAVTVFPSGAEVVRSGRVTIAPGTTAIVFRDLPPEAVAGSVRVDGKASGPFEIGAVDTRRMFVPQHDEAQAETDRKRIEKQIEALEDQRKIAEARVTTADTQRALIGNLTNLPNRPPAAAGAAGQSENWNEIIGLIERNLSAIALARLEAESAVRDLELQIKDLRGNLASLAPTREERTEVTVAINVQQAVEADLTVRYQVPNASWSQSYDARLKTGSKTEAPSLNIVRRATITQRTGEVWDNVAIQLSTTRPSTGTSAPQLQTLSVDYPPETRPLATSSRRYRNMNDAKQMEAAEAPAPVAAPPVAELKAARPVTRSMASVEVGAFQAVYTVPGRASVMNTGEAKTLDLTSESLVPALSARSVPKKEPRAFLYANVTIPKGSPMLPGRVVLFRDGTFVGNGHLPLLAGGEKHELGFGADDLVRVRYTVVQEKRGETGLISSSKTDERNYKISIKNLHERAIDVSLLDQLPVSRNEEIKVEMFGRPEPTERDFDGKAGVVRWDAKLEADQEKIIDFGYRVVWPGAKSVIYQNR